MWSLPSLLHAPDTAAGDTASFRPRRVLRHRLFVLRTGARRGDDVDGLSGSPAGGAVLGLAFVFGMTLPLSVLALAWDRFDLGPRRWLRAWPLRLRLAGRQLVTNTVNVVVAVAFTVMGVLVLLLAGSGEMTTGPAAQVAVGRALDRAAGRLLDLTGGLPEPLLGLAVLALAAVFVIATLPDRHRPAPLLDDDTDMGGDPAPSCHHTPTDSSRH